MNAEFHTASDVVNKFFSGISAEKMHEANGFLRTWNEVVGTNIAAHSKVIDVDRGAVIIEVDHPGWAQQIQLKKRTILDRLKKGFPDLEIKNLVIRVECECNTPYKKGPSVIGAGIPRSDEESVDVKINSNVNGELKDVLERLKDSIKKGKPAE